MKPRPTKNQTIQNNTSREYTTIKRTLIGQHWYHQWLWPEIMDDSTHRANSQATISDQYHSVRPISAIKNHTQQSYHSQYHSGESTIWRSLPSTGTELQTINDFASSCTRSLHLFIIVCMNPYLFQTDLWTNIQHQNAQLTARRRERLCFTAR